MNYPIELRKTIYASVVPVVCGDEKGTGFFVAPDTLLTARHVIVDFATNNQPVIVKTGKDVLCDVIFLAESGDPLDVVMLKCNDYRQKDHLNLLADVFNDNRQLTIVGYPKEFGGCTELISIEVQDRLDTKKEAYDTMVVRTDALAFTSYKGFSGSPVFNEKGSVIGITVQQYNSSMGYVSIKGIAERLWKKGIGVSRDWQSEDFSPLGRGSSQRQVEKAIGYAALRYNRKLHVADARLDGEFDLFANRKILGDIESELGTIESLALHSNLDFKSIWVNYNIGDYNDLYDKLYDWREKNGDKTMSSLTLDFYNNYYERIPILLKDMEVANVPIILLTGNAGMGKTHYICSTAERLCKQMNVYLLFGSQFVQNKDFETQLYELMGIGGQNLQKLNDKMTEENSNAIILIDALNEGATEDFWNNAMLFMEGKLEAYNHIKLIITFRDDEDFEIKKPYQSVFLRGFGNKTDEAITKYFDCYKIQDENNELRKRFRNEFNEPLFLSMFCQVAHRNIKYMTGDFTYSDLFHEYIKYRNDIVSKGVDEDSHRNITEKALMKYANYSLYYKNCNDIPRQKARHYADHICRNRTWSQNLLHWLLKENLMLSSGHNGESLMFGYQKMGNFLMADVFAQNKMTDKSKVDFILEKGTNRKFNSYRGVIMALLSEWNLTPALLERDESKKMFNIILNSLKHYGRNNQAIFEWMQKNGIYNLQILHDYFYELPLDIFMDVHHVLKDMEMPVRDKAWSVMVNEIYSSRYHNVELERFIDVEFDKSLIENWKKKALLLSWMCTSPHPFLRGKVIRKLVALFNVQPSMVLFVFDEFYDCNDPYVVQVCICAIYGYLLRSRNKEVCAHVAEKILLYFYQNNTAPQDILVRQWTMLILSLADELIPDSEYFNQIHPPFRSDNPFDVIIDSKEDIGKEYFGLSKGALKMYDTLYGFSDFKRYIIGTNSHEVSYVFMQNINNEINAIPLVDILQLIANIAKHDFKWNDDLGKLDDNVYSYDRYNNMTERFGKKYLWLALYKVDALLSDHFRVVDASRYVFSPNEENLEPTPYPWHTHEYSRIDPSIIEEKDAESYSLFHTSEMENVDTVSNEQWLSEEYLIQKPRLIVTDTDGSEWIVLTCYDGHKTNAENDTVKDLFLFTNAAFINNEELDTFKGWAIEQNFYGRWMPECRNGSIDYLWNEYPWAPTYKRIIQDIEEYIKENNGKVFHLNLSYEAQLQEEWVGLDSTKIYLGDVSMPNHHVMACLNLYTAERGVVRDKTDNSVVARNFRNGKMNGLAMRKEYLEKYLSEKHQVLVFYSLGEKYVSGRNDYQIIGKRHDLSGAYYYDDSQIIEIQPMHISNTL